MNGKTTYKSEHDEVSADDVVAAVTAAIGEVDATDDPATIARAWLEVKQVEDAIASLRTHIGKKLANLLPVPDGAQSKTHTVGEYKVTIKPRVNYSVDWPTLDHAYEAHIRGLPESQERIALPEKMKRELDEKGLRWIRENAKDLYLAISQAITATPGTTGITIEHKPEEG